MEIPSQPIASAAQQHSFANRIAPSASLDARWYAVYTCAQHEKTVAQQLELRCIESFLPLYEKVSRWKDRRVRVQLPLFPGYVFVHMALPEKLRVLQISGVVRLVGFNGHPAPLEDQEMEAMRNGLRGNLRAEPHPFLTVGRRVRVKSGPLAGVTGILLRRRGTFRVVISVGIIQRSVMVEIGSNELEMPFEKNFERSLETEGISKLHTVTSTRQMVSTEREAVS